MTHRTIKKRRPCGRRKTSVATLLAVVTETKTVATLAPIILLIINIQSNLDYFMDRINEHVIETCRHGGDRVAGFPV